jgi:hypothetical protein
VGKALYRYAAILLALHPSVLRAQGKKTDCSEVTLVRHIPFHPDENVNDAAYNRLRMDSWTVVPCLIRQITNSALTPDPRSAPAYPKVRVGDIAFWVIRDITGLPYDSMFPTDLVQHFPKEGVYAYFEWVNRDSNRKKLRNNVERWYLANEPK